MLGLNLHLIISSPYQMPSKLLQCIFETLSLSAELSNANYYIVPITQKQAHILQRGKLSEKCI